MDALDAETCAASERKAPPALSLLLFFVCFLLLFIFFPFCFRFSISIKNQSKTILKFNMFLISFFFIVFGSFWVAILEHFGHPNRPKIASSRLLNPHFLQKVDFQKNERHRGREHDFDPKTAPKTSQDRPKTAPRRSSRASFFNFVFVFDFDPFWVAFWLHLGPLLGSKN